MKNKIMLKQASVMLITGVLTTLAYAQPVYKWQDAKGATHYTQTPPPAGVAQKKVDVRSRTDLSPTPVQTSLTPATPDTGNSAAQTAATAPKQKMSAADCQAIKSTLADLNSGRRMYENDANGERSYLTEEQKAERISTYSKNIADACN